MSVTKIIFRQNRFGSTNILAPDGGRCGEPLFYKNQLFIRSLKCGQMLPEGATDEDKQAMLDGGYTEGEPILIGPYEHPTRNLNILGTNVTETVDQNTGVSKIEAVHTSPTAGNNYKNIFRAISSIETTRDLGHTVTANAELAIEIIDYSNAQHGGIWPQRNSTFDSNPVTTLFVISDTTHSRAIGFQEIGHGFIDLKGTVIPNSEYWYYDDPNDSESTATYDYQVGTGDCLVVTDADFSTTVNTPDPNNPSSYSDLHDPSYNHMAVRSKIAFDTTKPNQYLARDGQWRTVNGVNIAASTGDTTVKGVVAGSVSIDSVETQFTVQPANSYFGAYSGEYYYTGQGVVRPLGTTTGIQGTDDESSMFRKKLLYISENTQYLNALRGVVLKTPAASGAGSASDTEWAIIPVYVDYHKVNGTDRVEAVPYIMLPKQLLASYIGENFWNNVQVFDGTLVEGTVPEGSNSIVYPEENP